MAGTPELVISGAMLTHAGCHRVNNQDAVLFVVPRLEDPHFARGALALVADGMGGHRAGEVASGLAAEVIARVFYDHAGPPPKALAAAFAEANRLVFAHAQKNAEWRGMGTTCTAVVFQKGLLFLAHAGDSRAYLLRDGSLRQLSEDHSWVMNLVRAGALSLEEAKRHPDRNVIMHSVGTRQRLNPAIWADGLGMLSGDRIILCSDGLSDCVSDDDILALASRHAPAEASQALLNGALSANAADNVSVGVFEISAEQPKRQPVARTTREIQIAGC